MVRKCLSHHCTKLSISCLYEVAIDRSDMRPRMAVSSENLIMWILTDLHVHSSVYRVNRTSELTHPWGALVLVVKGSDNVLLTLTCCLRFGRNEENHLVMKGLTFIRCSVVRRTWGWSVLKAALKSTNNSLA